MKLARRQSIEDDANSRRDIMDVDVPLDWHKGVFPFWGAGWGGTHHVSTGGTPFDSNHCRELVYSTVVMTGPVNERKRPVYET